MRPVLAEMGGKNPAFVAASADLAVAASGVARSAFGLRGRNAAPCPRSMWREKCSMRSSKLWSLQLSKLVIGDPRRRMCSWGRSSTRRRATDSPLRRRKLQPTGSIVRGGNQLAGDLFDRGYYVAPTIVTGLPGDHRINRDELFVPFLSVLPFDDLDEAIARREPQCLRAHGRHLYAGQSGAGPLPHHASRRACSMPTARAARRPAPGREFRHSVAGRARARSGKGGLGSWYVPQFMREQSHTIFGSL